MEDALIVLLIPHESHQEIDSQSQAQLLSFWPGQHSLVYLPYRQQAHPHELPLPAGFGSQREPVDYSLRSAIYPGGSITKKVGREGRYGRGWISVVVFLFICPL